MDLVHVDGRLEEGEKKRKRGDQSMPPSELEARDLSIRGHRVNDGVGSRSARAQDKCEGHENEEGEQPVLSH